MANEFIARNGITSLGNIVVSGSLTTTGAITISGSIASASFATNAATASSADNLLVRSTLTAQTLVVQTITSSVDFVTGSTRFGSLSSNTHVFTGSMAITGGFALNNGAATFGSTISLADDLTFTSTNPQIKWTSGSLRFTQLSSALTYLTISSTGAATFSGSVDIQNANKLSIYRADNARALQLYTTNNECVVDSWEASSEPLHIRSMGSGGRIQFFTSGSEKMRIASDGKVGIGTSSPLSLLDVNVVASGARRLLINYDDSLVTIKSANGSATAESLRVWGDNIYFHTGSAGSELMRLTNTGRVGIGTSTPSGSRLHVFIGNDGGSGTPGVILATSNGVNDIVRFQDGTTTVAVVKNNGNIGILNTDPQSRLHIGSALASSSDITNGFILKQTGTNETTGIYLERSGERKGYAIYIGGSLDSLVFQRNNAGTKSDVLTLTRDGYILMGTSSVGYGLFSAPRLTINPVNDGITVGPLTQNKSAYTVQADNSTGQRYALYIANSSSSEVGYISFTNSAVNYTSTSDYRLKKDLKSFKGIDLINLIKTYDFAWKIDDSRMYGVIAHELQEVLPYAVTGEKDGETMQGVDYGKLTPVLVKAIQELKAENDSLKSRIEILESK